MLMDIYEYMFLPINVIPDEIIQQYNLSCSTNTNIARHNALNMLRMQYGLANLD